MKKIIIKFILLLTLFSIFIAQTTFASITLFENKSSTIVSKGVMRENITRFTNDGSLNINVLRVDLTDPYIKLDTIFSNEGISTRSTVLDMANESNAISAINGDFFSPKPNTSLAHSIGPIIQNGKIISTPADNENKYTFGVFALNKQNRPYYLYLSKKITLTAPNNKKMTINDVNKFGWYTNLFMYDSNWGEKTVGKSDAFPTLTQMVVVNNRVKSINPSSGPIDIPENGFVICGDHEAGTFLRSNFRRGSKVKIDIKTTPNWKLMNTAIGGGTFLVKNGRIPKFSHDIGGLHPRTALGTTKDNKQAILVTVDGRHLSSKGMSQIELANLMIELGAYNSINFDGGGSTTMVSKDLGENELKIINRFSDSYPRLVTNGIGIFSTAPKSNLYGIKITSSYNNVFKNSSIAFSVAGFDKYYNPVDIDSKKVKWSVEGVTGNFKNNIFYPSSSGQAEISANINGIKDTIKLNVLDYPSEINIYPSDFILSEQSQKLKIFGKDKYGYKAQINLSDIKFSPSSAISIDGDNIKLKNEKYKYVKTSFGNVYTYLVTDKISTSNSKTSVLDDFENEKNSFWNYPQTVKGSYSLSNEIKKSGKYSGKLEFDFSETDGTKAAYIKLNKSGYKISSRPSKINMWVYSQEEYPHSIKAEFIDANNEVFRTTLSTKIDWTNWKQLSTKLPSNIKFPVTLRKIYIVQTDGEIKGSGKIYFDDLKIFYSKSNYKVPSSKKLKDYEEASSQIASADSYNVSIFGDTNKISSVMRYKLANSMNTKSDFSGFINVDSKTLSNIKNDYIINDSTFLTKEYSNSLFVTLSAGNSKSIRKNDYNQWISLSKTLESNTKDNVFILLDCSIDEFSDYYEANFFKETLSNYVEKNNKNVWVIYSNNKSQVNNEEGVKYIGISNKFSIRYLNININDDKLTYSFKRMY